MWAIGRRRLLEAQGGICPLCGKVILDKRVLHRSEYTQKASVDHVIPKVQGGVDRPGNYLVVHWACNSRKAGRYPFGCELIWLEAVNARLGIA